MRKCLIKFTFKMKKLLGFERVVPLFFSVHLKEQMQYPQPGSCNVRLDGHTVDQRKSSPRIN